jgi:hypothetical protein
MVFFPDHNILDFVAAARQIKLFFTAPDKTLGTHRKFIAQNGKLETGAACCLPRRYLQLALVRSGIAFSGIVGDDGAQSLFNRDVPSPWPQIRAFAAEKLIPALFSST